VKKVTFALKLAAQDDQKTPHHHAAVQAISQGAAG
jgi:hypothetical protein